MTARQPVLSDVLPGLYAPYSVCSGPVAWSTSSRTLASSIHVASCAAIIRAIPNSGANSAQINRSALLARCTAGGWRLRDVRVQGIHRGMHRSTGNAEAEQVEPSEAERVTMWM